MNGFQFEPYRPRLIESYPHVSIKNWTIKVYTITLHDSFRAQEGKRHILQHLESWVNLNMVPKIQYHKYGFLIIHEGRDGLWSLLNRWLGGEMLHTTTYFTSFKRLNEYELIPQDGSMACVWEQEVITYEHLAWKTHILNSNSESKFTTYLFDKMDIA